MVPPNELPQAERTPLGDSKESLEIQKLQHEIAGLRRWWLHGPFLSLIASLLFAAATIGIGFLEWLVRCPTAED
jgi:hypothetical protein